MNGTIFFIKKSCYRPTAKIIGKLHFCRWNA